MPPHEGHDEHAGHGDGAGAVAGELNLPVRHHVLRPGAIATGCVLAAVAGFVAQFRAVFAGLVWDDRSFLTDDARLRSLSTVWRAFGQSFWTADHPNEMYRPLVNATLAVDWFVSGSEPGSPTTWWFHAVNLLLHAANSALVYLLFANLTKRRLGAPLIAAVLFAVHPLAVEPTTWIVGRCDLLATLCGLLSAVLLLRSPGKPKLVAASVAVWGLGLFAKASLATMPLVVAAGLLAYHQVEPKRLLTKRLLAPFLWFALPAAVWAGARWAVLGGASPFPTRGGLLWQGDVGFLDRLQGVGRAVFVQTAHVLLPVRLCGDYAGDVASRPQTAPWDVTSFLGLAILAACVVLGVRLLRRHAAGFPLLAYALVLVPVLQIVPVGAILADRFLYLPMAFLLLLVAEGLEHLYYRWGPLLGLTPTLLLFAILPVMSHLRAPVWRDDTAFLRDVAAQYPAFDDANYRLAFSLSESGRPEDLLEAHAILMRTIRTSRCPDDELALLGALELQAGELSEAEESLRLALRFAGRKRLLGARIRWNLGVCLKRQGRVDEAAPLQAEARRRAPELFE